jgi:hypothetical protein
LSSKITELVRNKLPSADPTECVDLLTIMQGRVLQIRDDNEVGNVIEQEVRQIVNIAGDQIAAKGVDNDVRDAALDILRYLPVRSAD